MGKTTLGEVEQLINEPAEVSLFAKDDSQQVIEAYFDNVDFSGLRARMVLVVALGQEEIEAMFERGERIATMAVGRAR